MRVQITITGSESFNTECDGTYHGMCLGVALLDWPYRADWKQEVEFKDLDGGSAVILRTRHPQTMEFYVDFINNIFN